MKKTLPKTEASFFESGAKGRIRTADLRLMSPALYRLSYPGKNEI